MKKNYKKENYKNNKDLWIKARGFGGSSASAILGANPYLSKLDLWLQITNKKKPKNARNAATTYGTKCEPLLVKMFQLDFPQYKVKYNNNYTLYRRIDKEYITATLDGELKNDKGEKGILEIKTHDVRGKEDETERQNKLPQNYFIQVLHYLMCLNDFTFAILMAKLRYFDKNHKIIKQEIKYYHFDRKELENEIKFLEEMETDFQETNIEKNIMPKIEIKL